MANPPCPPPPVTPPVSPPAPIPILLSSAVGRRPGSLYVVGSTLVYVSSAGTTFHGTGVSEGAAPENAVIGSVWPDGEEYKYIDESGIIRRLQRTSLGARPPEFRPGGLSVSTGGGRPTGRQLEWMGETLRGYWWNGA